MLEYSYPQLALLMDAKRAENALAELAMFRAFSEAYCAARSSKRNAARSYLESLEEIVSGPKKKNEAEFRAELKRAGFKFEK